MPAAIRLPLIVTMVRKNAANKQADTSLKNENEGLSTTEQVLAECHRLYTAKDNGLVEIGKSVGLQLMAPRKKIIVMLMGNHSAGKSSFINWYIEENVQKTGVAVETQGFTFVTSGKRRETLTGKATLHLYPHFKALEKIKGVVEYLNTEICSSKVKNFPLVTFVDTPGLVDGEMSYPFDVEKAITWLGNLADQIFVFFDPMGQALCRRTVDIVERLVGTHGEKIHFFLSKADEAGQESDRQKVLMQIAQELCKRPGLNKCFFELPTIFIPDEKIIRPTNCTNQIESVCTQIEKAIKYSIQNTLNTLEKDCETVTELINAKIEEDNLKRKQNLSATLKGVFWLIIGLIIPIMGFLMSFPFVGSSFLRPYLGTAIHQYTEPLKSAWRYVPPAYKPHAIVFLAMITVVSFVLARLSSRPQPCLSRKEKNTLVAQQTYIHEHIRTRREALYTSYLSEVVSNNDLG